MNKGKDQPLVEVTLQRRSPSPTQVAARRQLWRLLRANRKEKAPALDGEDPGSEGGKNYAEYL